MIAEFNFMIFELFSVIPVRTELFLDFVVSPRNNCEQRIAESLGLPYQDV